LDGAQGHDNAGVADAMPTLRRLFFLIVILAGLAYGGAFAIVEYLKPPKGEITSRVPNDRFAR